MKGKESCRCTKVSSAQCRILHHRKRGPPEECGDGGCSLCREDGTLLKRKQREKNHAIATEWGEKDQQSFVALVGSRANGRPVDVDAVNLGWDSGSVARWTFFVDLALRMANKETGKLRIPRDTISCRKRWEKIAQRAPVLLRQTNCKASAGAIARRHYMFVVRHFNEALRFLDEETGHIDVLALCNVRRDQRITVFA